MPDAQTTSVPTLTDIVFERVGVGLCLVAPDGTVIRANAEWLRTTGFTEEQVVGEKIVDLFPDARDMALAMHARARAGHRVHVPRQAQIVNGREAWWEGSIDPVPMEGGTGLLITAREASPGQGRADRQHAIIAAIARIFENALSVDTEEDLGRACLSIAEELTRSAFGFIAEINPRTGRLDDIAISDPGWEACRMPHAAGHGRRKLPVELAIHGIYGRVVLDGRSVLTNDPASHPDSIGTPVGHPPLRAFLGVPLVRAGETWGMIAVGNREGGYGPDEVAALEALAPAIVQAFMRKRAGQALRDERAEAQRRAAELQALLDTVPAAVWISRDARGDRIDANRFGAELLRRPPGSNVSITAPGDERPMNFRVMKDGRELTADELPLQAAARFGREIRDFEFDLVFENGAVRHLLGNSAPILDERGAPHGSVGAFIDITERTQAEEAMRAGEEEARARAALVEAVLDCIGDGVIVYDREVRTVRSSPAADAILRLPVSERQGPLPERAMRQYDIRTEDGRRLGPDEMIAVRAAVYGETIRGAIEQVRSGNSEPQWLLMNAMPLFVSGKHTGAVLSMTDITERKRSEAELATVTRLYAVLTRVNEAIVRTRDEQSLYEAVCRIVAEDGSFPLVWVGIVKQREVAPVASAGCATGYLREIKVELEGELGQGPTGTCIREDRPVINYDFTVNPAAGPWREATQRHGLRASVAFPLHRGGKPIGALTFYAGRPGAFAEAQVKLLEALCADISYALDAMQQERLRTEAEAALRMSEQVLREADRRKDEFLGMLSHELRNPLAPIRNSSYILRHAEPGSERARRAQEVIERQAEHLTRLVDDLLDVTRIARGKIELRPSGVDLREVVLRAADDFRVMFDDRGVAFDVTLPRTKVSANADPTRVTQILGNLLHNAAKFTRRGDEVAMSLAVLDGAAEIRVRDTGVGIDPALLPTIFDAFVQGERTLARTDGGLGLGLALVKGITELHGGTVRADSAGKGKGSEFVVRLPLLATPEAELRQAPRAERRNGGRRVLVVDDNADAAESLADVIRMLGHSVEVAYDGPTAIEKARANPPDVVLCDIGLPGMSGYDVAQALRTTAAEGMQVIAVSGYAQPEDVKRAIDAGFDGHLAKPCDAGQIERLLG